MAIRTVDLARSVRHLVTVAGELDRAVVAQQVGGVQEEDVQRVALDPLAAVQQPPHQPKAANPRAVGGDMPVTRRGHRFPLA